MKDRDVIIAADWDGSFDVQSWKATEKAKATLEAKGNTVSIILPVKNPELTNAKRDFNDLLKQEGLDSVIDRVSDRLPGVFGVMSSPRELSTEESNERQKDHNLSEKQSADPGINPATDHAKDASQFLAQVDEKAPQEAAIKDNVLEYFERELSLDKNKYFNKENILQQVSEDPLDYLKYWQESRGGLPFDPTKSLSSENGRLQDGRSACQISEGGGAFMEMRETSSFISAEKVAKEISQIDKMVEIYGKPGRCKEQFKELKATQNEKLIEIAEDQVVLERLKSYFPDLAERAEALKQDQQQIENPQQKEHSHGIAL